MKTTFNNPVCILRIEDTFNQFIKDIKVEKLDSQDITEENILKGISEKIFAKYVDDLNSDTCKVYIYVPVEISKEKLLKAWNDRDVTKAKTDIDDILSKLSDEQKAALLAQYQTK